VTEEPAKRKPARPPRKSKEGGRGLLAPARWPKVVEMRASGHTLTEIARHFKVVSSVVYRTVNHPPVAAQIQAVHDENLRALRARMQAHAAEAFAVIVEVARGAPDDVGTPTASARDRLEAAKQILDRTGLKVPERLELSGPDGGRVEVAQSFDLSGATPAMLRALAGLPDEPEPLPEADGES
jgi:hypothetical protein